MPIWCHSQPDITNTLRAMATFSTMSLHMLQMGIWSPHHAVTTTLVGSHLENQLKSWITAGCQMIPSCSGWGSHPTWNDSHIKRWLTNILCCGWGYGAPIMLLPPHLWDQIWRVRWNHGSLLGVKWYHHAVVEALIPHGMIPTSTQNIYKVIDKHYMLWMGIWSPHHAVTTTLAGPDLEVSWNHRSLLGVKWYHHAVVEALISHGMIPTSTPKT